METIGERQPNTFARSQLGWTKVAALAALTTSLLFALLNWHGCWLFRNAPQNLAVFFYPSHGWFCFSQSGQDGG
jgi:hypothetical protein